MQDEEPGEEDVHHVREHRAEDGGEGPVVRLQVHLARHVEADEREARDLREEEHPRGPHDRIGDAEGGEEPRREELDERGGDRDEEPGAEGRRVGAPRPRFVLGPHRLRGERLEGRRDAVPEARRDERDGSADGGASQVGRAGPAQDRDLDEAERHHPDLGEGDRDRQLHEDSQLTAHADPLARKIFGISTGCFQPRGIRRKSTGRMPTFKLDGKDIPFEPGESIIKAANRVSAETQGDVKEIPHYCWHAGLSAPANCRMCLVEIKPAANLRALMLDIVEWDAKLGDYKNVQKPKLQPACQMQAVENQEVLAETSHHVHEARKHVQEFLLLNHPVDCPICDQAGECKLQDYWLEHQGTKKRMRDEPLHKPKAVVFGPTIVYDAERCVMCTRCIRFMDEVAKDPVLDLRERGNLNEVFVAPGRQLEGHYTFMTEHVCPVGALTTKDFRFKARVWFLRTAKSVCQGCATGCNSYLDFDPRSDKAFRYRPRDNEAVNKYWMCDEGMLSYRAAHEGRVIDARIGRKKTSVEDALKEAKKRLDGAPKDGIAFVLSAQHSQEDNWAFRELAKLAGATTLYWAGAGAGYHDDILIDADKNPNSSGVVELVPNARSYSNLLDDIRAGKVQHVVALGGTTPRIDVEDATALGMLGSLIVVAAHEGAFTEAASVTLPATSWAEHNGTYVNRQGFKQTAEKALFPQGASRPAWEIAKLLGQALGLAPNWSKLKDVRGSLANQTGPSPVTPESPTASA